MTSSNIVDPRADAIAQARLNLSKLTDYPSP